MDGERKRYSPFRLPTIRSGFMPDRHATAISRNPEGGGETGEHCKAESGAMSDATTRDAAKNGPQEPGFPEGERNTGAADVQDSGTKIGLTEWSRAWCSARPRSDGVSWSWASMAQALSRDSVPPPGSRPASRHARTCSGHPCSGQVEAVEGDARTEAAHDGEGASGHDGMGGRVQGQTTGNWALSSGSPSASAGLRRSLFGPGPAK